MRVPLLVALTTLSLTACDQLYLEASVPNLCQHLEKQKFSVPPEVRARYEQLPVELRNGLEVGRTFDFDVSLQVPAELQGIQSRFALTNVTVKAVDSTPDLGFIDSAAVTIEAPESSGLPPHTFSYERTAENPVQVTWAGDDFDLSPYLHTGTLRYALSMAGRLPEGDVLVDIDACASAAVKLNYLQQ
jgi:hypothetical protein